MKFEAMSKNEMKVTTGVVTKRFFKVSRSFGLNLADFSLYLIPDFKESFVG